jgi:hypothetical protein
MTSVGGGNPKTPGPLAGLAQFPLQLDLEQLAKFDPAMQKEIISLYKMAMEKQAPVIQSRAPPSVMKSAATPGISLDNTGQNVWYTAWVSKNKTLRVCVCICPMRYFTAYLSCLIGLGH